MLCAIHDFLVADLKERHICVKFCFILGKTASETHEMLKRAFGDNAMERTDFLIVFLIQM
jgi:hypothetical protein